jgi:nuclear pore complex protein Nup210
VHSIPKSEGTRPDISVSIYASLKEHEHVLGSASALFIGGFSIMEMGKVWNTNMEKLIHEIFCRIDIA